MSGCYEVKKTEPGIDNPSENAGMSNEKGFEPSPKAYGIILSNGL